MLDPDSAAAFLRFADRGPIRRPAIWRSSIPIRRAPARTESHFGKLGNLYVALAGYSQISVLKSGRGGDRPLLRSSHCSGVAAASGHPANIGFDQHGSLLVTNHASLTGFRS